MTNNFKAASLILLSTTLLSGCDTFSSKEPLPGKREAFLISNTNTTTEVKTNSLTINVDKGERLKDWPVQGGQTENALPPLFLPTTLTKAWHTNIGYGISNDKKLTSNLIIADGVVYAMDSNGKVSAVRSDNGTVLWSLATSPNTRVNDTLGGGIAFEDGMVFVATSFGEVLAINAKDGKPVWTQSSIMTPMRIAPTVKDGRVFVITIANELYALSAKDGTVLWNHVGLPETTSLLGGATPAISDSIIVVPYSSGEVHALRVENGYPLWNDSITPSQSLDSLSSIAHIRARPVISDGVVYVVSHGGRIVAIELNTGIRLWQREISGIRTPAVLDNYLFVLTTTQDVICLNRQTGETIWSNSLPQLDNKQPNYWAGPVIAGESLVFTGSNGEIRFLSVNDGKLLRKLEAGEGLFLSPVIANATLYALSNKGNVIAWR